MLADLIAEEIIMFSFEGAKDNLIKGSAPLAQLVEQLTLNQWVPGSSP